MSTKKCLIIACFVVFSLKGVPELVLSTMHPDPIINMVRHYLPDNPVIMEAGAYDGAETLRMKKVWPGATIHAFEPIPQLYEALARRLKGIDRIFCYQLALSDTDGVAKMAVSEPVNCPGRALGSSSLLAPKEHLKKNQTIIFPRTIDVNTATIEQWAKANNVQRIDFMWLDAQGVELLILKSAGDILKTVKALYVEVEFVEAYAGQALYQEVDAWIRQQGFERIARDFDWPRPQCWFGNCLYVRRG